MPTQQTLHVALVLCVHGSACCRASGSAAWSEMRPGSAPPSSRAAGSQQPRTTSFSSRGGLSPGLEPAASSATNGRPTLVESGRARSQAWHVRPGRSAAFLVRACTLRLRLTLPGMHSTCLCWVLGQMLG